MRIKSSSLRTFALWCGATFFGVVILSGVFEPLLYQTLQDHGALKKPEAWLWTLILDIIEFLTCKWFYLAAGMAVGFALGVWLDAIVRKEEAVENISPNPTELHKLKYVRTVLRLRFSGEAEVPTGTYAENIQDWFAYWSPSITLKSDDDKKVTFFQPPSWILVINFKEASDHHQIVVNFSGNRPASWEVKRSLPTSVIIAMEKITSACEMEIINTLQPIPT